MERKTIVTAENGVQTVQIVREFDLPLELLFKAYEEPELIEQWMNTKVQKLENKQHGSFHFITTDPRGNAFGMNGAIHEFSPNKRIVRTFEMENTPFGIQLEFLDFEALSGETSKLTMNVLYESVAQRDQLLQLPFIQGINMAHNRIQNILTNSN
jgi:uncharacterized protein YndB with AHSA1/START domain